MEQKSMKSPKYLPRSQLCEICDLEDADDTARYACCIIESKRQKEQFREYNNTKKKGTKRGSQDQ